MMHLSVYYVWLILACDKSKELIFKINQKQSPKMRLAMYMCVENIIFFRDLKINLVRSTDKIGLL